MERRLRRRRALSDLALGGGRETWHLATRWIIGGLTALTALLVAFERHRVCEGWGSCDVDEWSAAHTLLADHGGMPLFLLAIVGALQLVGVRARFFGRAFTAAGSWLTAFGLLGHLALTHLLSNVAGGGGAVLFALLLVVACLFQLVLEPLLAVSERRRLEATDEVIPRATVVTP